MKNDNNLYRKKIITLMTFVSILGTIFSIFVIRKNAINYIAQKNVEVEILSVDKKEKHLIFGIPSLKKEIIYITNILYDNNEYAVYGKETYEKYKSRIDEKTTATFNIIKYKNKEDEYEAVSLA